MYGFFIFVDLCIIIIFFGIIIIVIIIIIIIFGYKKRNRPRCLVKTQSNQRKDEEVNATSSRDRTFFEKRGTMPSMKTSTPKNLVELSDDE